ncbi:MAG: synthase assembly protein [Rhizobium sp.]|nr:synthase assembly protein [Rhizobium sp.]
MATDPKDSLEDRMSRLEKELAQAKTGKDESDEAANERQKGYSQALKLSSEFIAAVIVGAMIGYLLDLVLPTKPWGLIVFLLLGFCAGVLNVLRTAGVVNSPHPVDRLGEIRKRDKER